LEEFKAQNNPANAAYSPGQVQRHGLCVLKMSDVMDRSQDGSPAFARQSIQPADPCRYGRVYISASGMTCSSKPSIATPQVQIAFQDTECCCKSAVPAQVGQDRCTQSAIHDSATSRADCSIVVLTIAEYGGPKEGLTAAYMSGLSSGVFRDSSYRFAHTMDPDP
jgi:hypothetical protein